MYENVTKVIHNGKEVYLDKGGVSVKPILKDVTKPFSWNNLNWTNILYLNTLTAVIIACLILSAWGFSSDTKECYQMLEHPCSYAFGKGCLGCVMPSVNDEFVPGNSTLKFYEEESNYTITETRW